MIRNLDLRQQQGGGHVCPCTDINISSPGDSDSTIKIRTLFDSGANASFMSKACVDKMGLAATGGKHTVDMGNAVRVHALGTAEATLHFGDTKVKWQFGVLDQMLEPMILGMDFFHAKGVVLDSDEKTIKTQL